MPQAELTRAERQRMQRLRETEPQVNLKDLVCPDCQGKLRLKVSRYGRFYGCTRWKETGCRGAVSANEDGSPRGTPADKPTRALRKRLIELFQDRFRYPGSPYPYGHGVASIHLDEETMEVYERHKACIEDLCQHLGRTKESFAIGLLNAEECEKVLTLMEQWGAPKSVWTILMEDDED